MSVMNTETENIVVDNVVPEKKKRVLKKKGLIIEEPKLIYYVSYEDADRETESYATMDEAEDAFNKIIAKSMYSWVQICEIDGDKIIKEWAEEEADDESVSSEESESSVESDDDEEEVIDVESIKRQQAELAEKLKKAELKSGLVNYKKDKKQVQKDIDDYVEEKRKLLYKFCEQNDIPDWLLNMMPDGQNDFLGSNPDCRNWLIEKIYNMKNKPAKKVSKIVKKAIMSDKPKKEIKKVVVDGEEVSATRQKHIEELNANKDKIVFYNYETASGKLGAYMRSQLLCLEKDGVISMPTLKEFNALVDGDTNLSAIFKKDKKRMNFKQVREWIVKNNWSANL